MSQLMRTPLSQWRLCIIMVMLMMLMMIIDHHDHDHFANDDGDDDEHFDNNDDVKSLITCERDHCARSGNEGKFLECLNHPHSSS